MELSLIHICRTQLKLVEDMEAKWDQMQEIVQKVSAEV